MKGFGWVQELCGGSCGEQGCGDLAGDEAALADAGEDDAMAALRGGGEQGCNPLKDLGLRSFEALGELLERLCLDADEVGGAIGRRSSGRAGSFRLAQILARENASRDGQQR